jgi:nicotinamidase-related amidase
MKKILNFCLAAVLLTAFTSATFSQAQVKQHAPVKPALLVIDVQNAYVSGMAQRDKDVSMLNINYYIQLFRSYGCPVIRIYHYSKQYGPEQGTEQFEFPSSVLTKPDDPKIIKTYANAFTRTDLDKVLKEKGVNTVFLCGLSAVGCVLATWVGAQDNDYKAFLIKDALLSHNDVYTNNIEAMFDAVGPDIITLVLEGTGK